MTEREGFDVWLAEISLELAQGAHVDRSWLGWLRALFETEGALSRDLVFVAASETLRDLIRLAEERIGADLRATTGRELRLIDQRTVEGPWLELAVELDGDPLGAFGHGFSPGPEVFVAELADYLQEFALDEAIWGGWPTCPVHQTHPLAAEVIDDVANWRCPVGRAVSRIGGLTSSTG